MAKKNGSAVAKLERPDLLPILESYIDQLPDALLRPMLEERGFDAGCMAA